MPKAGICACIQFQGAALENHHVRKHFDAQMTHLNDVVSPGTCDSAGFHFDYKGREKWVGGVHITYWVQSGDLSV